jgi:hypothetical protein
MKTFASAILLAASVSAGFDKLINFDFNDYFVKTERSEKPALGAYDYNWSKATNSGDYLASLWLMGDMVAEYTLPFDDTADGVSWTLTFNPQLTLGGKQTLTLETPYLAVDFFLDIWPGKLSVGKTQLKWDPPLFENFCMSSGWSLTLLDFWLSMDISVWECDAGLFDWILNGDGYECGLETYSFENDIYNLHFSTGDKKGDWITNTCEAPIVEEIDTIEEEEDTTESEEVTTLNNAADWF